MPGFSPEMAPQGTEGDTAFLTPGPSPARAYSGLPTEPAQGPVVGQKRAGYEHLHLDRLSEKGLVGPADLHPGNFQAAHFGNTWASSCSEATRLPCIYQCRPARGGGGGGVPNHMCQQPPSHTQRFLLHSPGGIHPSPC